MPTYEYICGKCGCEFEKFESINAKPVTVCPKCKGRAKRSISIGAGVIFKGSGFHSTDYRKHEKAKSEEGTKPSDSKKPDCSSCKAENTCPNAGS
ncbi:FmdB family zinc ribbon protein [Spirochaetota bacterium]